MSNCVEIITAGILKNCATINAGIGSDKDLILVNYVDVDIEGTKALANRETDDTNGNEAGLSAILLKAGAVQYTFEGTDYSVVPTVTPEVREDGNTWYVHSLNFISYSKLAKDRKTLQTLGTSKVVAIAKDRSTGLYEIFGLDQGLKVSGIERAYVGTQNSNFYTVTIATPEVAVVRESTLGELAIVITTAT